MSAVRIRQPVIVTVDRFRVLSTCSAEGRPGVRSSSKILMPGTKQTFAVTDSHHLSTATDNLSVVGLPGMLNSFL